jgi:Pectate lyase superfamily protein/Right handed beta helix region
MNRRHLLAAGAGLAVALPSALAAKQRLAGPEPAKRRMLSAADFGAVGDGAADDTAALQSALDATFNGDRGYFLTIPPGEYRVTRTLRVALEGRPGANVTRLAGITAYGARLVSDIADGQNVFDFITRAAVRFILIEGLTIQGKGREGHGLNFDCNVEGSYLYNSCLRDVIVQACGGDGLQMVGNIFETQIFNSYFRDNKGNGAMFGHGPKGGILSAMHVFGCVFGGNGNDGVALTKGAADVSFHGSYFLLNGKFGLSAPSGCTQLSNCGFENNHQSAPDFAHGDAGIRLQVFGTLIGCTAYSIHHQTHLVRAFITNQLVMIGCTASGGGGAKGAKLAKLQGNKKGKATLIGCHGAVEEVSGIETLDLSHGGSGMSFGSAWDSPNLPRLGDYRLWVDAKGKLRLKKGSPGSDGDGAAIGG